MFSANGYFPFINFVVEIAAHAEMFHLNFALPLAMEGSAQGRDRRIDDALAAKFLLEDWIIERCLLDQPVPIFLASPSGSIIVASRFVFDARFHVSDYEFDWPLSELPYELREELNKRRSVYWNISENYIFLSDAFTLDLEGANEEPRPRDAQLPKCFIKALKPFDGWSTCIRYEDLATIRAWMTETYTWRRVAGGRADEPELEERHNVGGRPSKRDPARVAYHQLYPHGHEAAGITLKEACKQIGTAIGKTVSADTLNRALGKRK